MEIVKKLGLQTHKNINVFLKTTYIKLNLLKFTILINF